MEAVTALLDGLRQDIAARRIRAGMARLEDGAALWSDLDYGSPYTPQLIWRLAEWVDIGWRDSSVIRRALGRFPAALRTRLPLPDYAAVRAAEGMLAMSLEDVEEALHHFNTVLTFGRDLEDRELLAIAHFWKARCQRKKGEYEQALAHTVTARTLAAECGFDGMAAVMRVLESWLLFQKGRNREALRILQETEAVLSATDDAVVLGNIQSTYGRIFRQEGHYDRAIQHFQRSIEEYRKVNCHHPNLARTLANLSYVERLVALDLRRKIDAGRSRSQQGPGRAGSDSAQSRYRGQFERILHDAFSHLDEAAAIYAIHLNHHGAGTVHLNRGLLHLDSGALDLAEEEATRAFALGEEKEDTILMARARLLQCMVENGKLEEGIEGDPRRHAQAALEYIRDALQLAQGTQNRRLLARVHTWHGLTLCNEFFGNHQAAIEAMNAASALLDHGPRDTAWEDLYTLKKRVLKSNTVDETLLAWSQGAIGNRTFRQIADQFAEILIPKVWEMEGRKIARVARRLAISPKKVRRVLNRAGLGRART